MIKNLVKWLVRPLLQSRRFRAHLDELAFERHPLLRSPFLQFAQPGHFYSPLPDLDRVEADLTRLYRAEPPSDGIDLNDQAQRDLLATLGDYSPLFVWPEEPTEGNRYWTRNPFLAHSDAFLLFAIIQHFSPRQIIEVGSGFSSALMLDINDRFRSGTLGLSFIEPHPERLQRLLTEKDRETAILIAKPVQEVPLACFEALGADDILFVDSSHVSKIGSDVNYIVFEILPRLREGVLMHFHDLFYPWEYPIDWIREGRAWNELYLLRAFLQYNAAFEIVLFNSYVRHRHRAYVETHAPCISAHPGGSLWLRKTRRG